MKAACVLRSPQDLQLRSGRNLRAGTWDTVRPVAAPLEWPGRADRAGRRTMASSAGSGAQGKPFWPGQGWGAARELPGLRQEVVGSLWPRGQSHWPAAVRRVCPGPSTGSGSQTVGALMSPLTFPCARISLTVLPRETMFSPRGHGRLMLKAEQLEREGCF